jgi:kynureninase
MKHPKLFLCLFLLICCSTIARACSGNDNSFKIIEMFSADEAGAKALDQTDPLQGYRNKFVKPRDSEGRELIYFNAHVMGLAPVKARQYMQDELTEWENKGSDGRFEKEHPWYSFHEKFRGGFARLLGAYPEELVIMNTLSTNMHLAMVSFYRPTKERFKIIIEAPVYISDVYIIRSQIRFHGFDPDEALVIVESTPNTLLTIQSFRDIFEENKNNVALEMVSAVNHLKGQVLDIKSISELAHENSAVLGLNLAHAVGNIPLELYKDNVDFAVWCNYKYMSGGPGAVGGLFVHERHVRNPDLHRFVGWWGSDPKTRINFTKDTKFIPVDSADSWQPSEPSVFSMVPLQASLEIFDEIGMTAYREKSIRLTSYLEYLIDYVDSKDIEIITPRDINKRGAQLSLLIKRDAENFVHKLQAKGVVCDFKKPNIIRITPVPLYNSYHDVWMFANALSEVFKGKTLEDLSS